MPFLWQHPKFVGCQIHSGRVFGSDPVLPLKLANGAHGFPTPTSRTSGAPPRVKAIVLRQALMAWHVSGNTWSLTITLTSGLMIKTRDITWKSLRKCYRPHWPMMRLVRAASTLWQQVLCHIYIYGHTKFPHCFGWALSQVEFYDEDEGETMRGRPGMAFQNHIWILLGPQSA